jgi:hypothetical protein
MNRVGKRDVSKKANFSGAQKSRSNAFQVASTDLRRFCLVDKKRGRH